MNNDIPTQDELNTMASNIKEKRKSIMDEMRTDYETRKTYAIAKLLLLNLDGTSEEKNTLLDVFKQLYLNAIAFEDYEFICNYLDILAKNENIEEYNSVRNYLEWKVRDVDLSEKDKNTISEALTNIKLENVKKV